MSKGVSKKPRRGRPTPPRSTDDTLADIFIPSDEEATALVDPLPACMANGSDDSSRLLPLQQVARIIRKHLAPNTKVSRDAALLMREAASEFICFIASEARDISVADKRRSITPQDIFESMVALDFEEDARALHCWTINRSRTSGVGSSTSTSTTSSSTPSSFPSPSEQHEDPPEASTSAPRTISPSPSPSVRQSPLESLAGHYTASTMSMPMPMPMPMPSTWMPVPIPGGMSAMSTSASTHILALQHEYWRRMGHMGHMSHMSHMSHRVTAAGFGQ